MAKKYPFRRKKYPRRSRLTERALESLPAIPDRRAIEGMMRDQMEQILGVVATATPLAQAQRDRLPGVRGPGPPRADQAGETALDISPDCADAYVVLAENARTRKEAFDYYEKGVAAGERAIGPNAFQEQCRAFLGTDGNSPLHARP